MRFVSRRLTLTPETPALPSVTVPVTVPLETSWALMFEVVLPARTTTSLAVWREYRSLYHSAT